MPETKPHTGRQASTEQPRISTNNTQGSQQGQTPVSHGSDPVEASEREVPTSLRSLSCQLRPDPYPRKIGKCSRDRNDFHHCITILRFAGLPGARKTVLELYMLGMAHAMST